MPLDLSLSLPRSVPARNVLALDPGARTGWAIYAGGSTGHGGNAGKVTCGTTGAARKKSHPGGHLLALRVWLTQCAEQHGGFDLIAYERAPFAGHGPAMRDGGHYEGTILGWAAAHEIAVVAVNVGTWRKAVLGNGRAGKKDARAYAQSHGIDAPDHNAAEAYCVLVWALNHTKLEAA